MAQKKLIDEIKSKLETYVVKALKDKKPFYIGDPIKIPASRLPTIIIEPISTEIVSGATGRDEHVHEIMIKVIADKRVDFGKPSWDVAAVDRLMDWAEGIDADTGELKATSVAGILRKYLTLDNEVVDQSLIIEYGVVPREEFITMEAWIRVVGLRSFVLVSNRE